jgi:hypothetical protein
MDYVVSVEAAAAAVYRDFTTIDYWAALVEHYRGIGARTEVKHFSCDDTGTDVSFAHIMSAQDLPSIARPMVPGVFVVTREQHFDPFETAVNRAVGRYNALIPVAPVKITGRYVLADAADGSQMRMLTSCEVKVPLIGGQIEQFILTGLKTLFAKEGEFTAAWIGHRHR